MARRARGIGEKAQGDPARVKLRVDALVVRPRRVFGAELIGQTGRSQVDQLARDLPALDPPIVGAYKRLDDTNPLY